MQTQTENTISIAGAFKERCDAKLALYETKRAALLEVLHLVQEELGYITLASEVEVAKYLELPPIDVREVMTFYTLYYTKTRAKKRFNVCRTLSCSLLGGKEILKHLEEKLGVKSGETTSDGKFSIQEVECLGACEIAPMLQLDDNEYHGCLTKEKIDALLKK